MNRLLTSRRFPTMQKTGFAKFLTAMLHVRRQRVALSKLDDHILEDIGLTPSEVRRERELPIWDVPQHWRR